MKKDKMNMVEFSSKYNKIKPYLSVYSCNMIETFINLFGEKIIKNNNKYNKENILSDLDVMYKNIDNVDNEKIKYDLIKLKEMINNKENYLDLYIRLQLALGLYPNDFFFSLAYDYFYREVYVKIMNDEFIDEYKEENFSKHRK